MTPHWLALREAARRWLKGTNIHISTPIAYSKDLINFIPLLTDVNPRYLGNEKITVIEIDELIIHINNDLSIKIGGKEPLLSTCWINSRFINQMIEKLKLLLLDLASAGYPGCSGCGGADAENWDEQNSRKKQCNILYND